MCVFFFKAVLKFSFTAKGIRDIFFWIYALVINVSVMF